MTKEEINFIKKADKFKVLYDGREKEFLTWKDGATFYNQNVRTAHKIEISAICGVVGLTIAYKYA